MANTTNNDAQVMLRMHDIHKSFGDLAVLKGIDVEVRRGEVLAIIGPSGSGKSTLLRCINKLETIDSGSIEIEGEFLADTDENGVAEYADVKKAREILSHTGMVFQQFNLFPHMTVLENLIEAPIQVKGMKKAEILPYAKELLEKVRLADRADYNPSQLSGGQHQRVAGGDGELPEQRQGLGNIPAGFQQEPQGQTSIQPGAGWAGGHRGESRRQSELIDAVLHLEEGGGVAHKRIAAVGKTV